MHLKLENYYILHRRLLYRYVYSFRKIGQHLFDNDSLSYAKYDTGIMPNNIALNINLLLNRKPNFALRAEQLNLGTGPARMAPMCTSLSIM